MDAYRSQDTVIYRPIGDDAPEAVALCSYGDVMPSLVTVFPSVQVQREAVIGSRWMHQNKAQYTGAYVEGVLVDSFVVETKRGIAAIYEHALNEWTSNYYVEFTDYKNGFKNGEVDKIWSNWYAFEEKASA